MDLKEFHVTNPSSHHLEWTDVSSLLEEVTKAEIKFNLPVSSTPCFSLPQVFSNALF